MKKFKRIFLLGLLVALCLGCATVAASADTGIPCETNPFVEDYYIDETNQEAPFFDVVLPQIAKNIDKANKHSFSPYYDNFNNPNNPENFQGLGSTSYANINGKTVTAEGFYRVSNEALNDPNCGLGLMVYQCIQYKRAHPDEDVKITFTSYRTAADSAICVVPGSKYYGYMKALFGCNYDEHGFVRLSYMLTEAARMGIEVTIVNNLKAYGRDQYNPATGGHKWRGYLNLEKYYEMAMATDCYDKYEPGKKVSDFMDFCNVDWTVTEKTADMQHVKSASVSHYLDVNGKEHKNAIFLCSANFDIIDYKGANGNNGAQSGIIITNHDDLYRVLYNYTQLMADYRGMEDIYELRKICNQRNEEQKALIESGKGDQIPKDEQILYLGTKNDPVFQLWFTPLGGGTDTWDPEYNPMSEHLDYLTESEDYIEFSWNEYQGSDSELTDKISDKLAEAFCKNPNVNNKVSIRFTDFNTDEIKALKLGTEIGYRSIKGSAGHHCKDMVMSYVKDGMRHNVSILTSCNMYPIAFNYRTNSILIIDETAKTGGNFYETFTDKYSYGMLDKEFMVNPANLNLDKGTSYKLSVDSSIKSKVTWKSSNTAVATVSSNGTVKALKSGKATITATAGGYTDTVALRVVKCVGCDAKPGGQTFNTDEQFLMSKKYSSMPLTFEATFSVDKSKLTGNSTLLGSDDGYSETLVYSLNKSGQPRVAMKAKASKDLRSQNVYTFKNVNVATGSNVHMAIVTDFANKKLHCYVNGKLAQTLSIKESKAYEDKYYPIIGGDHLNGNTTFFPGEINSIAIWSDKRTAKEIANDYANGIDVKDGNLISAYDLTLCEKCMLKDLSGNGNTLEYLPLWQDAKDVKSAGNYEYTFALVGDTQTMCENDPKAMEHLYDWIIDNKESKKIAYVLGLGDITDDSTDREWVDAKRIISKLNGKIPYALTRGNHDAKDDYNKNLNNGFYEKTIDGVMTKGDLTNSYRKFNIQGTDYLIMSIDFGANQKVMDWANSVIKKHPKHKVIVITHAYMYRDGTTIDEGDLYAPSWYGAYHNALNGDEMWEKCFSKHKNVLMVISGHDPWQHVVYRQDKGDKGNYVTQMLVDAQYVDLRNGSVGMVALMHFSNDGKTITMRYYSVEKDCYGSPLSQFTINLDSHKHTYKTETDVATITKNGKTVTRCTTCDYVSEKTLYMPKTFTFAKAIYSGNVIKPALTVKDSKGNVLEKDKDYIVTYLSSSVNAGTYKASVVFKGDYSGTKTVSYKITPATPKTIKLSKTSFVYNGKVKTPVVTVKNAAGKSLKKGTDYTVTYEKGRKVTGKYTVTVKGKGNYTGTKNLYFTIKPAVPKITSSVKDVRSIKLTWKKVAGADGYYVSKYNAKTKNYVRIATVKKGNTYTVKKLNPGTKYSFKVRAFKNDGGVIKGDLTKAYTTATKTKKPSIKKIKSNAKGKVNLTWSNVNGESGYQVFYSTKKNANYKKASNFKANVVKGVKGKLKSGKVYYFKVRTFKQTPTGTVYSAWSKAKRVKVK